MGSVFEIKFTWVPNRRKLTYIYHLWKTNTMGSRFEEQCAIHLRINPNIVTYFKKQWKNVQKLWDKGFFDIYDVACEALKDYVTCTKK